MVAEGGHKDRDHTTQDLGDLVKHFTLYSEIIKRALKDFKQGLT